MSKGQGGKAPLMTKEEPCPKCGQGQASVFGLTEFTLSLGRWSWNWRCQRCGWEYEERAEPVRMGGDTYTLRIQEARS